METGKTMRQQVAYGSQDNPELSREKKEVKVSTTFAPPFQQTFTGTQTIAQNQGLSVVYQRLETSTGEPPIISGLKSESKGWGGSQGQSSAGTSGSVRRLLQHVIAHNITGVKPILKKTKYIAIVFVVVFAVLAILARTEISRIIQQEVKHTKSIYVGSAELTSFISLQTNLLLAHLANTEFRSTVGNTEYMWDKVQRDIGLFIKSAKESTDRVIAVGGDPKKAELDETRPVVNKFTNEKDELSTVEIRDFLFAHLRVLRTSSNGSNLVPGSTQEEVKILMDNAAVAKEAFNVSSARRLEYFGKMHDKYAAYTAATIFSVLVFLASTLAIFLVYSTWVLGRDKKEILRSFLLIPLNGIKRMRTSASTALRENLEQVHNAEILGTGESDDEDEDQDDEKAEEAFRTDCPNDHKAGKSGSGKENCQKTSKKLNGIDTELAVAKASKLRSTRPSVHVTDFGERKYRYSKKFLYMSIARAVAPLALLLAWGESVYEISVVTLDKLEHQGVKVRLEEYSLVGWMDFEQDIVFSSLRLAPGTTKVGNATLEERKALRQSALFHRNTVVERLTTLLNGKKDVLPETSFDSVEHDVWTRNGCFLFTGDEEKQCLKTSLKYGLRVFVREFLNRGLAIMGELPSSEVENSEALAYLRKRPKLQAKLRYFHEMLAPLAVKAITFIVDQSLEEADKAVDRSIHQQEVATASFVICYAISVLFVTMPVINKAGNAKNASFNLLVLIPEDLLSSTPKLRSHIKGITEKLAASQNENDATTLLATQHNFSGKERE